jgi:hypothetical protein
MNKCVSVLAVVVPGVSIGAQGGPVNTLTATEKAAGWPLLLDGKKVLDARHAEFKLGAIGLRRTGQDIEFRNIKVKPL